MAWMNQHGFTVFLKISPESAIVRLSQSKVKRPILIDKSPEELTDFIKKNYAERMPIYEQAQLTFKGENCDVETLATLIPKG